MKKRIFYLRLILILLTSIITMLIISINTEPEKTALADVWDGSTATYFAGGSGIDGDPYQIANAEQLALLADIINDGVHAIVIDGGSSVDYSTLQTAYYELSANIELNDETFTFDADTGLVIMTDETNIAYLGTGIKGDTSGSNDTFDGTASTMGEIYPDNMSFATGEYAGTINDCIPIGTNTHPFAGNFNGAGFTVSRLYINNELDNQGLFGHIASSAKIENTGIIESYIKGYSKVGAISGSSISSIIDNCYNESIIMGTQDIGGIVGINEENSTIQNSYNTGKVVGLSFYVAGIAADNINGSIIQNCYNTGFIRGVLNNSGGIVARNSSATIQNCYNTGNVSAQGTVGGISGYNGTESNIRNCYNTGLVEGTDARIGGIVGYNNSSSLYNSYNIGTVKGLAYYIGGVVGYNLTSTVENTYYLSECAYLTYDGTLQNGFGHATPGEVTEDSLGVTTGFNTSSVLASSQTVGAYSGTSLLNAINAWVDTQTPDDYLTWAVIAGKNDGFPMFETDILTTLTLYYNGSTLLEDANVELRDGVKSFSFDYIDGEYSFIVKSGAYDLFVNNANTGLVLTVDTDFYDFTVYLYSVSYDKNGATGTVQTTFYYVEGIEINVVGNFGGLAITGYAFAGFGFDADGIEVETTITMGTEPITLYAIFMLNAPVVIITDNALPFIYGDTLSATYTHDLKDELGAIATYEWKVGETIEGTQSTYNPDALATSYEISCKVTFSINGDESYQIATKSYTVNTAVLTVNASSHTVTYGDAAPAYTVGYSGFVNSESETDLDTLPTATSLYAVTTGVSQSGIVTTASGGADGNYSFIYIDGAITIEKKELTVTASSHTVTYGDAIPVYTVGYSGFVNSESETDLDTLPTATSLYAVTTGVSQSGIVTTASGGADGNYSFIYIDGAITIEKKELTVTASSHTVTYGDAIPVYTVGYSGFVNSESETDLDTLPTATSLYAVTTGVSQSGIVTTASGGADGNYSFIYIDGAITIEKKELTVTASSHTVTYGDAIPVYTVGYSGFVNSESETDLDTLPTATSLYAVTTGVSQSGIVTTASGGADGNYSFIYIDGAITIEKKELTVTASSHTVTYGDAIPVYTVGYSGFVNSESETDLDTLPTATSLYAVTTGVSQSGIVTTASGGADGNYSFSYIDGAITIEKKELTVTASSHTVTYGDAIPVYTVGYSGFVNSESETDLDTLPTATSLYAVTTGVSQSGIVTTASGGADGNYSFIYIDGAITIEKKELTVTASSHTVTYGDAIPVYTVGYSGFVNSESETDLDTLPTATSLYAVTTGVSQSGIVTTASGGADGNYSFIYIDGAITIEKKELTVTASSHTVTYGDAIPVYTVGYSGFVNSESETDLDTLPTATSLYAVTTGVSQSGIVTTASGGADGNYSFIYIDGAITIEKKELTVTASSHTVTYGDAIPVYTVGYSGFVNSESETDLDTLPTATSLYAVTTGVSQSGVVTTASGGADGNYSFIYIDGAITIEKKELTVTASSHTVTYGDAIPVYTVGYSGFVNSESETDLDTLPTATSLYAVTTGVSQSGIVTTASGGADGNYSFIYIDGAITIEKKELTVTASSHTVTYGDAIPVYTVGYSGFVNSESETDLDTLPTATSLYAVTTGVSQSGVVTTASGGADGNYSFIYIDGAITIEKKELTVTASSHTVTYGDAIPVYTVGYSGFVNSESETDLDTLPTATSLYAVTTGVSQSGIVTTASGGADGNYSFIYIDGAITIEKKELTVTASSHTVTYGDAIPVYTVGYSGFVNSESETDLDTLPTATSLYAVTTGVSQSGIVTTASGGANGNYSFNYIDGSITITIFQETNSWTITLAITGWTYGDSANAPSATATYGTAIFTYSDSEEGTYTSTVPTNAGTWCVKAKVAETNNYTGLESVANFVIAKVQLTKPTVSGTYLYTGNEQTVTIDGFDNTKIRIDGGNAATDVGEYVITLSIIDIYNYEWASGNDGNLRWAITEVLPTDTDYLTPNNESNTLLHIMLFLSLLAAALTAFIIVKEKRNRM